MANPQQITVNVSLEAKRSVGQTETTLTIATAYNSSFILKMYKTHIHESPRFCSFQCTITMSIRVSIYNFFEK